MGLHCLNEAGHNETLVEAVRQRLLYPETMEAVVTVIESASMSVKDGTGGMEELSLEALAEEIEFGTSKSLGHWIHMTFTSMSKGLLITGDIVNGRIDHRTCEVHTNALDFASESN